MNMALIVGLWMFQRISEVFFLPLNADPYKLILVFFFLSRILIFIGLSRYQKSKLIIQWFVLFMKEMCKLHWRISNLETGI